MGRFVEVCRRRGLKVNVGKSKGMALNGEEGLESEVHVDGVRLEHAYELKYLECLLDETGIDGAECIRKMASGRRVEGAIKSLVNATDLQIECARVLHKTLLVPVLTYGNEIILWKEKERCRIGPYRWTTSEDCLLLGRWIDSRMHG